MKIINNIKTFLYDKEYFINIFDDKVHVFNYIDLEKLTETEMVLRMDSFVIAITGSNLHVTKMAEREIMVKGTVDNVGFKR